MNELIKVSKLACDAGVEDQYNAADKTVSVQSNDRGILTRIAEAFSAYGFVVAFNGSERLTVQL